MGIKYDEKSCGVVIYREKDGINLYLLLHYPGGHWDFPKGHVEQGEDERQTASRELVEETGISDFQFVDGFREEVSYEYRRHSGTAGHHHGETAGRQGKKMSNKQVVFFLAKTNLEEIKLSHEHHHFKWLPFGPAFNKLTFDNARNLLRKAKNFLEK